MVCFKNGKPSKADYRKFNIKTVEGINDFASMKEAVYRHYKRVQEENNPLPQLVIIDGGKGQLNAAHDSRASGVPAEVETAWRDADATGRHRSMSARGQCS